MTSSVEIHNILSHIDIYQGVYPCNKIPQVKTFPCVYILNTDTDDKKGEHWVALYFKNQHECEYYDSYGLSIENEYILRYLYNLGFNHYRYNTLQYQDIFSKLCGYYVIAFVLCKSKQIPIISFYKKNIDVFIAKNLI